MRSSITRAALSVAGAAAFVVLASTVAAADQSALCVYVPDVYTGTGPRPMTTYSDLCVPWTE